MAEFRLDRFKFNWKGTWRSNVSYTKDDIVHYKGKSFVCLLGHTSTVDFYNEFNNGYTIEVAVTVGVDNLTGNSNGVFYFNNVERPNFNLLKGNTYRFLQNDVSNLSFAENSTASPLGISTIENGTLAGGNYAQDVRYFLNEIEVTASEYYQGFAQASTRFIEYTPSESTPENLFYYGNINLNQGSKLVTRYSSYWEQMTDGQAWDNEWQLSTKYSVGQFVKYGAYIYKCIEDHTSTNVVNLGITADLNQGRWEIFLKNSNWLDEWSVATRYAVGDVVRYNANVYICSVQHISSTTVSNGLEIDASNWTFVAESFEWLGDWSVSTRYKAGDVVKYGGIVYECLDYHTSALDEITGLEDDLSKWKIINSGIEYKGEYADSTRYKLNDVVKSGGSLWKCSLGHEATGTIRDNSSKWDIFVPGLEYDRVWNSEVEYTFGDVVLYGGYLYVALENNLNQIPSADGIQQDTGPWELITRGYTVLGDWTLGVEYKPGDVVRHNGYLYVNLTDTNASDPDSDPNIWKILAEGQEYRSDWVDDTEYRLGDVVVWQGSSYVCILRHDSSTTDSRPDLDIAGTSTYWNFYVQGDTSAVLNTQGDIIHQDASAKAKLNIGAAGKLLKVVNGDVSWENFDQIENVFYVAPSGLDAPTSGTQLAAPFKTIKYACEHILANVDTDNVNTTIFVKTGIYQEELPIKIPRNCAVVGDELRSTNIQPAAGFEESNMFYVNNGSGLRNCTLQGLSGTLTSPNQYLTRRTTAGAYVSLDPGTGPDDTSVHIINKSPYVQNVTTFGTGCIGMKIDGALHNSGNDSIVANDFTQVIDDGIGYWATNGGRSELVSVFTYFCHIGYLADDGGILRATNGNNSYGTYGSVAEGFDVNETATIGEIDNTSFDAGVVETWTLGVSEQKFGALGYDNAGREYTTASISFSGSGANAAAVYEEFRNGAVEKIDVIAPDDSSTPGGLNYIKVANNAQGGNTGEITIAQADVGTSELYVGQRIVITSGLGKGQYAEITGFDETTKRVLVSKETDGTNGWEHFVPGWPIAPLLDETTRYQIEPRPSFANPVPNSQTGAGSVSQNFNSVASSPIENLVRVSEEGTVEYATSTNLLSWTDVTNSITSPIADMKVIHTGNTFVIYKPGTTNIDTSNDGQNWSQVSSNYQYTANNIIATDYNGSVLISDNANNRLMGSTNDGVTFTAQQTRAGQSILAIEYFYDKFVIVWDDAEIYTLDAVGGTAQLADAFINIDTIYDLEVGNNIIALLYLNTDGKTYLARNFSPFPELNTWSEFEVKSTYRNITYGDGQFILTGINNEIGFTKGCDYLLEQGDDSTAYLLPNNTVHNKPIFVDHKWYIPADGLNHTTLEMFTKPVVRARVTNSRLEQFIIYDPGAGYAGPPALTLVDNQNTIDTQYEVYVHDGVLAQPRFTNRGIGYTSNSATITGDGKTDRYQTGQTIVIRNVTDIPGPGANLEINGIDDERYSIVKVISQSGSGPYDLTINITPAINLLESPDDGETFIIRERYSQVRLTGHDFLDIGTGNVSSTRYPNLYLEGEDAINARQPFNETVANGGGRVFYTSTDQDGNFRVGELFEVEQSTGIVSVNATQFDLTGLTELSLGGIIVGGSTVVIREFSKDITFVANSNNIVPTQAAIKSYIETRISGGGSNANTNRLIAGQVSIGGQTISTTSDLQINVPPPVKITGGVDGHYLASMFYGSAG